MKMQEQVHEALEREKRQLNLVIIGIKEESEEEETKTDGFDKGIGTRRCRGGRLQELARLLESQDQ